MNAGAYGGQMSDLVECCEFFDVARNLRVSVPAAGCRYGYRSSIFLSDRNLIALSCTIRLSRGDSGEIRDLMRSHLSSRSSHWNIRAREASSSVVKDILPRNSLMKPD